jgi:hypothetical protein
VERLDVEDRGGEDQILAVSSGYVRACEGASLQSGTACIPVPLRLCIDTKTLKEAVLVGIFQRTILQ